MGKIYISGPITGADDYMERFERAESQLRAMGYYDIVNPARICAPLNSSTTSYGQYMEISVVLLMMCDAIYMLEGWKRSSGAKIEHRIAEDRGMIMLEEAMIKKPDEYSDTSDPMMDVASGM